MGMSISTLGAVCFFEWATVHVLAFFLMAPPALRNDIGSYYIPTLLEYVSKKEKEDIQKAHYANWIGRPLFQHAFNLGWTGCFSYYACYLMTQDVVPSVLPVISFIPWLTDFGYFMMAFDIPELGAIPGQAQTYIITTACVCAVMVTAEQHGTDPDTLHW